MKQFILEILQQRLINAFDNRYQARRQFGKLTPKELEVGYGDSGQSCKEILATYENDVTELEKAILWLDGTETLGVIKEIRKSDCGAWLKDCHSAMFTCADGREKRQELSRLLDKLYKVTGVANETTKELPPG